MEGANCKDSGASDPFSIKDEIGPPAGSSTGAAAVRNNGTLSRGGNRCKGIYE